ncbi:MAG TPA: hypothetical protein VN256_01055 [Pyrinomonadaceae bacterium]|nr:hypothetical protein [Pyrinomonadaceae bacterium]
MNETSPDDGPAAEGTLAALRELRRGLLHLHKALLDDERAWYEQEHGAVSSGELLQLVIGHEQFAWLHSVSELIVRIDELLDADEPATTGDAKALFAEVRALVRPNAEGAEFERKYYAAIQREPAVALAHRGVTKVLPRDA